MTQYNVMLHTPLGQRCGTLEIQRSGRTASGILHILKQSEPFSGSIEADGTCCFKGQLVTLTRTIPYQAEGRITKETVDLSLTGNTGCYRLTGVPV